MNIAVVGTGNVGSVLGRRLAASGHHISFVTRSLSHIGLQALRLLPGSITISDDLNAVIDDASVIIYAGPFEQAQRILRVIKNFDGRILVDCTNPLNTTFDGLQLGHTESAGEKMAEWAVGARVVKSFNTTSVATMDNPAYGEHIATQFYCGDDAAAKQVVAGLIADLGMEPVDAGPLQNSRYLEATAMLYIHLAMRGGWGGNCALKILRRDGGK